MGRPDDPSASYQGQNQPPDPDNPDILGDDPPEDPDLAELILHADRDELDGYLPTARRFLEAAGDDDWDELPSDLRSPRPST